MFIPSTPKHKSFLDSSSLLNPPPFIIEFIITSVRLLEPDPSTIQSIRKSLARFRCANHKLQIELGRQVKPVKVPVQQHYCKLCNLGAVEDEDHFLLVCPAYQSVRERFKSSLPLTAITPLAELLSCQPQGILARFLVQCQTIRSELLHQT
jgi:hypothetical protein